MSTDDRSAGDRHRLGQRMVELVNGYQVSAAIGAMARLGVADCLSGGPRPLDELARNVGADAGALGRVIGLLTRAGLFERLDDGRVSLTPLGEMLRQDVPGSAHRGAIVASEEWHWRAYGHLAESVRTGEPAFGRAHDCGFWEYLERHPQAGALINDAMSGASSFIAAAFVGAYDLSDIGRLVDVGGGHGALMRAALGAHPHMRGIVLDLPGVIEGTRARLSEWGLTERCEAIAGDFRDAVPAGGDAYVLSWVLHDWDDRTATRILSNCREAMGDAGRLLAIELVLPPADAPQPSPEIDWLVRTTDVEMLAIVGGRERTAGEYGALFAASGFELTRTVALQPSAWSVVEGVPV